MPLVFVLSYLTPKHSYFFQQLEIDASIYAYIPLLLMILIIMNYYNNIIIIYLSNEKLNDITCFFVVYLRLHLNCRS